MKNNLRKIYWFLSNQLGIDLRRMARSAKGFPRYLADLQRFRRNYGGPMSLQPCLYDWYEEGGSATSEYFLQDLHIAKKIHQHGPLKHVDIGSRIDGFVAHVASFREIEVFDIRAVSAKLPGIIFRQADLMDPAEYFLNYCDSISCLHALEHFGLGRYGDTLDPHGAEKGLRNITKILAPCGRLYLSVPIGIEKVVFNAHRIFNPNSLVQLANTLDLQLEAFAMIGKDKVVSEISNWETTFTKIAQEDYALGMFTFIRNPSAQ